MPNEKKEEKKNTRYQDAISRTDDMIQMWYASETNLPNLDKYNGSKEITIPIVKEIANLPEENSPEAKKMMTDALLLYRLSEEISDKLDRNEMFGAVPYEMLTDNASETINGSVVMDTIDFLIDPAKTDSGQRAENMFSGSMAARKDFFEDCGGTENSPVNLNRIAKRISQGLKNIYKSIKLIDNAHFNGPFYSYNEVLARGVDLLQKNPNLLDKSVIDDVLWEELQIDANVAKYYKDTAKQRDEVVQKLEAKEEISDDEFLEAILPEFVQNTIQRERGKNVEHIAREVAKGIAMPYEMHMPFADGIAYRTGNFLWPNGEFFELSTDSSKKNLQNTFLYEAKSKINKQLTQESMGDFCKAFYKGYPAGINECKEILKKSSVFEDFKKAKQENKLALFNKQSEIGTFSEGEVKDFCAKRNIKASKAYHYDGFIPDANKEYAQLVDQVNEGKASEESINKYKEKCQAQFDQVADNLDMKKSDEELKQYYEMNNLLTSVDVTALKNFNDKKDPKIVKLQEEVNKKANELYVGGKRYMEEKKWTTMEGHEKEFGVDMRLAIIAGTLESPQDKIQIAKKLLDKLQEVVPLRSKSTKEFENMKQALSEATNPEKNDLETVNKLLEKASLAVNRYIMKKSAVPGSVEGKKRIMAARTIRNILGDLVPKRSFSCKLMECADYMRCKDQEGLHSGDMKTRSEEYLKEQFPTESVEKEKHITASLTSAFLQDELIINLDKGMTGEGKARTEIGTVKLWQNMRNKELSEQRNIIESKLVEKNIKATPEEKRNIAVNVLRTGILYEHFLKHPKEAVGVMNDPGKRMKVVLQANIKAEKKAREMFPNQKKLSKRSTVEKDKTMDNVKK